MDRLRTWSTRRSSWRRALPALALLAATAAVTGCEGRDDVVARVGPRQITVAELRAAVQNAPPFLRAEDGDEAVRDYLQTLIDMELLVLEAEDRGLREDPQVRREYAGHRRRKLAEEYLLREVWSNIELPPEELRHRFAQSKWSRMLRLAQISTDSEAAARRIRREIEAGEPVAELVQRASRDEVTAAQGGAIDVWFGRGNLQELGLPLAVAEEVFDAGVGEVAGPFQVRQGWQVLQVLDEGPAPEWYRRVFAKAATGEEFKRRRAELVARLAEAASPRMVAETVERLAAAAPGRPGGALALREADRDLSLCRFEARAGGRGELTLSDFEAAYRRLWHLHRAGFDSAGIDTFTREHVLPEAVLADAAAAAGVDEQAEVAAWLEARQEALLIEALRRHEVQARVDTSDARARPFYEAHRDRFDHGEVIRVREILVAHRDEAQRLLERLRAGADMDSLARRHSLRPGAAARGAGVHMHPYEKPVFGPLLEAAQAAPVGQLEGPVQVPEGWSLFEVVERVPPGPRPFEEVASQVRYWVRKEQEKALFEDLLDGLRARHADRITIFEDRLASVGS